MARGQSLYAIALGCLSVAAVCASVFVVIPHWIASSAYRDVNQAFAPFTVETLAGTKMSSDDWKGHVVIVAFWATWCTPCQAELPEIADLQNKFRDNPNVFVLALNSGNHGETPSKAREYLAQKRLSLNAGIDSHGALPGEDSWGTGAKSLEVESLPALYILDRSGKLRVIHLGYDPSEHLADSLSDKVKSLL
jgi:thiol-disulfide isomerase/thioredoxin